MSRPVSLLAVIVGVAVVGATMPGVAGGAATTAMRSISGPSPFPEGCGPNPDANGLSERAIDSEVEPTIAVNPVNPRNIVAAWMQDYTQGMVVAATRNGGRTWKQVVIEGTTICSGGDYELFGDPWLAFDPEGRLYVSGMTLDLPDVGPAIPLRTRWEVRTSDDGGFTWSEPVSLVPGELQAYDRPSVKADPQVPGLVYAAGVHCVMPLCASTSVAVLRSEDGGKTWTPPRPAVVPDRQMDMAQVEVLPDGSIVVFAGLVPLTEDFRQEGKEPYRAVAVRSEDRGETWSTPITVAEWGGTQDGKASAPFKDPETGTPVGGQENNFVTDVAPDGTLYLTYRDVPDPGSNGSAIWVTRSADGGKTWTASKVRALDTQMFLPTVAVAGDGTVGVAYYDLRNDALGDAMYSTDLWFSHSVDGGQTWTERHLAGPFDLRTAMLRVEPFKGLWLGDYEGLAGLPRGFALAYALAQPIATAGASDIFFARIRAGRA